MANRELKFEIFRFNPQDPASEPHMQTFTLNEEPYMTLFRALNRIREEQDPGLQFDFSCRSAVCGSCGMMVNGRPTLACKTLTSDLDKKIRLHPLPAFKLVGDLSVDTGTWFRAMAEQVGAWIQERAPFDPEAVEERMDDDLARAIYESDRCIECGCCVASCGVANVRPGFVAPAGMNRIARFMMDPRDARTDSDWFEVVSSDDGVFGCIGLMACHDVCPKELPLLEVYAYLRRRALGAAFLSRK
ncbi:MAG: fumarate reductase [Gammaproteobacteria bacterium SG8_31]|jgi:fumarate reductase iron-sulfur subunit|nr:MAG: fumarate reductase [Gammaproteobacteria bacterium SG8_31]